MKLYDEKDCAIVAQAIDAVGPDSIKQRADMILKAAMMAMVMPSDMEEAIKRHNAD